MFLRTPYAFNETIWSFQEICPFRSSVQIAAKRCQSDFKISRIVKITPSTKHLSVLYQNQNSLPKMQQKALSQQINHQCDLPNASIQEISPKTTP